MNSRIITALLLVSFFIPITLIGQMKPIKKDGRYYYSPADTHKHIDLTRAVLFLGRKIFSPTEWIKRIASFFYLTDDKAPDMNEVLNPTQSVPAKESIMPTCTWIGHATFLIQINGCNILTDPIFGDVKVGPITLTKRGMAPGIRLEDLPKVDAIVISHNHSDHTDTNTLTTLAKRDNPLVFVPEGNKPLFESFGFKRVIEQTWWDTQRIVKHGKYVTISCLPAYHWSIRFSLGSYREALWSSWMISADVEEEKGIRKTDIYFSGDTAYGPHFKEIRKAYPNIDLVLMQLSSSDHKEAHVDGEQAVQAFMDLGGKTLIPMHYGTFFLSKTELVKVNDLKRHWRNRTPELGDKRIVWSQCGKIYDLFKELV